MTKPITCICGYRGPSVLEGGFEVCPLCQGKVRGFGPESPRGAAAVDDADEAERPAAMATYRIPCPNGHVLKIREDMLGQQVCCPACSEFFVARASDSIEFRRQQAELRAAAEEKAARAWLTRAIVAAVLIAALLAAMMVIGRSPDRFGK